MGDVYDFSKYLDTTRTTGDELMGDSRPETVFGINSSEGYEMHQAEVKDWLGRVTNGEIDTDTFLDLSNFANTYFGTADGFKVDEEAIAAVTKKLKGDPWQLGPIVSKSYVSLVISGPELMLFQQADLLAISADAISNGLPPGDGGKIVQSEIDRHQNRWNRAYGSSIETLSPWSKEFREYARLGSLATLMREWTPAMSRSEFYRHAASVISGERVTNVLKAFGIVAEYLDQPGPREIELRAKIRRPFEQKAASIKNHFIKRAIAGAKRDRAKAFNKLAESVRRYDSLEARYPSEEWRIGTHNWDMSQLIDEDRD